MNGAKSEIYNVKDRKIVDSLIQKVELLSLSLEQELEKEIKDRQLQ